MKIKDIIERAITYAIERPINVIDTNFGNVWYRLGNDSGGLGHNYHDKIQFILEKNYPVFFENRENLLSKIDFFGEPFKTFKVDLSNDWPNRLTKDIGENVPSQLFRGSHNQKFSESWFQFYTNYSCPDFKPSDNPLEFVLKEILNGSFFEGDMIMPVSMFLEHFI